MWFGMHQPVMLKEVISSLNLRKGSCVLDATIGGGGHSKEILRRILPGGRLIGLDADGAALKITEEALKDFTGSFKLINDNFRNLDIVLSGEGIEGLDAALFDIGISSYQIEDEKRGFSIKYDARLDMRMDARLKISAYDIINKYREPDLSEMIKRFGEERFHKKIARYIVEARSKKPIETTHELVAVIHRAAGPGYRAGKIDPATRTFQALRIAVNDELASLEEGLKQAVSWLSSGGRIGFISFHSLEDRIVKNLFKGYRDLGILKILTKKPIRPSSEEMALNTRSRSAKLRVAERTA